MSRQELSQNLIALFLHLCSEAATGIESKSDYNLDKAQLEMVICNMGETSLISLCNHLPCILVYTFVSEKSRGFLANFADRTAWREIVKTLWCVHCLLSYDNEFQDSITLLLGRPLHAPLKCSGLLRGTLDEISGCVIDWGWTDHVGENEQRAVSIVGMLEAVLCVQRNAPMYGNGLRSKI